MRHRTDQRHATSWKKLRLKCGQTVHWPLEVGTHHTFHQSGIHHTLFQVFAGSRTKNDQIGSAICKRQMAGLPVRHIEHA
ncbi:hypothetical protein D3C80_1462040 [compost metagenome]